MGYGSEFYRSIQLGIEATGQQGVDALANAMHGAERAFATFQAQLKAGQQVTAQQVKELADLKAAADRATEAYAASTRVIAGKSAEARGGIEGVTNAALQLSRGLEDLSTGGFLGILNNLPGIGRGVAQSFGLAAPQVAAVETAVSLLGTGSYLLYTHWQKLKDLMDDGTGPRLLPDLRAISKELDELRSKPLPTLIEQTDIQNLDRTVDRLGKIEAALKAMRGLTSDQQKAGKIVTTGVTEGGGLEAIVKSYLDATAGAETPEQAATRKQIADIKAKEDAALAANEPEQAQFYNSARRSLEKTDAGRKAADRANRETAARRLVGAAGIGDEASRAELAAVYDRSRPVFERNGASFRFRQALEDASPLKLHEEEQQKIAAESEKMFKDAMAKDVREAVQRVRKGLDDAAADAIQSALQAGTPLADASKAAKDAILPALKQRGIGKSIVGAVADEIVGDAADEARNRIGEGERSRLQVRRDQAKARSDAAVEQEINRLTTSARGGYQDEAERTIYEGLKRGQDADALQRGEMPALTKALRDRGSVPPALVDDVARKILAAATEKAMNDLDSGVAPRLIRQEQAAKDAATRKQDAADKRQVGDIGEPFIRYAEGLLARNRAALNAGLPVARSEGDIARYTRSGADFALPEGEARRRIGLDVAQGLKQTGQDPRLSDAMLDQARDRLGDAITRGMAGGGMTQQQALINIVHELADQVAATASHGGGMYAEIDALKKKQLGTGPGSGSFGGGRLAPGGNFQASPTSDAAGSKKNGGTGRLRETGGQPVAELQPLLIPADRVASALSRLDQRGTALAAEANTARRQRARMWVRQDRGVKQRPSTIQFYPSFAP